MTMETPPQYPPVRDMMLPKKNYEPWFLAADQDYESLVRPVVSISKCPFGDTCQHHNFRDACVWSFIDTNEVLSFLMQHGTHSSHHNLTEVDCFDKICDQWWNIEWSNDDDTFEDRVAYRETVRKHKDSQAQETAKGTGKAQAPQASARKGNGKRKAPDQRVKEEDDDRSVANVGDANAAGAMLTQTLCDSVMRAVDGRLAQYEAASSSDDRWSGIHDGPPSRAGPSISFEGAPGMQLQTAFPEGTISIPVGKLILVQDSLQRAEHAIVGGMTGMVETAKKMDVERRILSRTIDVLAGITGQKPTHAM